ncbi:ATP-binding protein [Sphingomonas sp.]|uniref:sensor histidine kinase n=1 Tax=Sphingomonas sp. TaxID=28214 RepID=UPI000DB81260|nr:ATP-binding protein [Sphingomonas sp.]PZU08750.1 MAG: hypothetical protein DI605_12530 [Sphingomonas sp.]
MSGSGALALGAGLALAAYAFWLRRGRQEAHRANAILQASNERLAGALAMREQFLATTSHEIRTPLNGILGMTQVMLADAGVAHGLRERIEIVQSAGERMRALIDDILDIAKIESGHLTLTVAPYDPTGLLREAARFWQMAAERKGLAHRITIGPLPALLLGDEARVRQILFNLLSNAVKFTSAGSVSLEAAEMDGRLVILVADSGIGIPADQQAAIFDRYRQADGGAVPGVAGTGLGLAICRELADAMDGTISVESVPGRGAVFRIDLPIVEAAAGVMQPGDAALVS